MEQLGIQEKFQVLFDHLDQATLRLWTAVEARSLGRGRVSAVAAATGFSRTTIYALLVEIDKATMAPANPRKNRL